MEGELVDGDHVQIQLKDRSKNLSEDEKEWYERAFGKKRSMMSFEARFVPLTQPSWQKGAQDIYIYVKYRMFPEMYDEFNPRLFDEFKDAKIKMKPEEDDNENLVYTFKKEFPYGDLEWEFLHRPKDNDHDEFQKLSTANAHNSLDYIKATKKPTPISFEQQRLLDQAEEEDNKKKEHEARMAQKKLEEEKERLKYEQQQLIAKQEQNTARLEVYLKAMNLALHRSDEDFNSTLSILSIFHLDLSDHFQFYSSLQPQIFRKKQNEQISVQSFIHFMKVMKLASSHSEALRIFESLHELIRLPLQDTLSIKNGLNYAMFLETIVRTAYHKLEENGETEVDGAYKNALEDIFNEGNIELKKRMMEDRLISELYSHDNCKVFYEHATLLAAVFTNRSVDQLENFSELPKETFMQLLLESGILTDKQQEEPAGEIKRKFNAENILATIHNTGSFDINFLSFVDFLDCLVRVAYIYPFPDSEKGQYGAMDQKLQFIIGKLNEKYGGIVTPFIEQMAKRDQEMNYQPRLVVDDELDDDYDDS